MSAGAGAAERARALIGVRFRPQGRDPALGLDCIGVVAMVFGLTAVRRNYALRSSDAEEVDGEFAESGFLRIAPTEAGAGDVLLVRAGPGQLHVVILTPGGYLHADAGLRRVVETPGAVAWPVLSAWRHPERPSPRSPGGESPALGRSCPRHDLNSAGHCSPDAPVKGEG